MTQDRAKGIVVCGLGDVHAELLYCKIVKEHIGASAFVGHIGVNILCVFGNVYLQGYILGFGGCSFWYGCIEVIASCGWVDYLPTKAITIMSY